MQSLVPLGPGKFHVVVLVHDYDEEIPYLTFYEGLNGVVAFTVNG